MCPRLHCHKSVCLPRGSVDRSTRYQYRFPLSASQFQPHSDFDFDSGSHSPHLQPHPHPNPHIHMCCPDIVIAFALRFSICADLCVVVMWFKGSVNHASCLILSRPRFPAYLPTQWNYFFVSSAPKSAPTPFPLQKKKVFAHDRATSIAGSCTFATNCICNWICICIFNSISDRSCICICIWVCHFMLTHLQRLPFGDPQSSITFADLIELSPPLTKKALPQSMWSCLGQVVDNLSICMPKLVCQMAVSCSLGLGLELESKASLN